VGSKLSALQWRLLTIEVECSRGIMDGTVRKERRALGNVVRMSNVSVVLSVASGMESEGGVVRDIDVYMYLGELLLGKLDPLTEGRSGKAIISLSSNSEGASVGCNEDRGEIIVDGLRPHLIGEEGSQSWKWRVPW